MRFHVKHLLSAYVSHELPAYQRWRVSRHIQLCDACYAALRREEERARVLKTEMPRLGAARPDQLARLLPGILAEVGPRPAARHPYQMSGFGVALVLSLLVVLFVPALVMPRVAADFALSQPDPHELASTETLGVTDAPLAALATPTAIALRPWVTTEVPSQLPPPAPVARAMPVLAMPVQATPVH